MERKTTYLKGEIYMTIDKMLGEEIQEEFEKLKGLEPGSEKHKSAVDSLTKLMDRAIEMDKSETALQVEIEKREIDKDLKLQQMEADKKDRLIGYIMTGAGIVLPLVVTIWGTKKSIEFEKEGTFTTIMGRGFIGKLLGKK